LLALAMLASAATLRARDEMSIAAGEAIYRRGILGLGGPLQGVRGNGIAQRFTRALSATDQRQGRTIHPIRTAGNGLRLHPPELATTDQRLG